MNRYRKIYGERYNTLRNAGARIQEGDGKYYVL